MTPPRFDIGTDLLAGALPPRIAGLTDTDLSLWPWVPGQPSTAAPDSPMAAGEAGRRARRQLAPWVDELDLPGI